jgi:SAM-dependent methyltransferase/folate-dependent phosphoribosylglycinamide formyltransferase PurN
LKKAQTMTIILYTRRNVALYSLAYLVAKGHSVKVITDDDNVVWLAGKLSCEIVTLDTMGEFDLFLCVHGNKIIDKKYLVEGKMVNVHPCLFKYKGHNPVRRYIHNLDTLATVESQWMIEEVDAGEVLHTVAFETPVVATFAEFYNIALPFYFRCLDATIETIKNIRRLPIPHKHKFIKSIIKDYEICVDCGTYHSTAPKNPKLLYEEEDYWSEEHGHSKPEDQVKNLLNKEDTGKSKIDKILEVMPYKIQTVLEIGCFPGTLLGKLSNWGFSCWGIEPAGRYMDFILENCGDAKIVLGYFPQVTKDCSDGSFDCIVIVDVFEHIEDYDSFIAEVHRLLPVGGKAIIMSPIIMEDGLYRERDFSVPGEHIFMFTEKFIRPYLENIFSEVEFDLWQLGHNIIICTK